MKDDPNLVFDDSFFEQITKLKADFESFSQEQQDLGSSFDSSLFNCEIGFEEVEKQS